MIYNDDDDETGGTRNRTAHMHTRAADLQCSAMLDGDEVTCRLSFIISNNKRKSM